jgi:hypothetical protein
MRKKLKERFKMYRGVGICINSVYTDNHEGHDIALKGCHVMLMTPDIERYFSNVGAARKYVDKNFKEIKQEQDNVYPF